VEGLSLTPKDPSATLRAVPLPAKAGEDYIGTTAFDPYRLTLPRSLAHWTSPRFNEVPNA
jgi:hypothetical protein